MNTFLRHFIEALGGFYLCATTVAISLYHLLFPAMSLIAATSGAILGVHGVWRLVVRGDKTRWP